MIPHRITRTATLVAIVLALACGVSACVSAIGTTALGIWTAVRMGRDVQQPSVTMMSDGRVLIAGGREAPRTTEIYDPARSLFTVGPSLPGGRFWHAAARVGDLIVLAGGRNAQGELQASAVILRADAHDFSPTGAMAFPRQGLSRDWFSITPLGDGTALVIGGLGTGRQRIAEIYDPVQDEFRRTGDMTSIRGSFEVAALHDGRVLVTGGTSFAEETYNKFVADADLYDPSKKQFVRIASMTTERVSHSMTVLDDGRVLIAGGHNDRRFGLASAEMFDPTTGSFTAVGAMRVGRSGLAAVRLADGRVLLTGGANERDTTRLAEIFDPKTDSFVLTTPMLTQRRGHRAILLHSGEVLVIGGARETAEIYRPGSLP